MGARNCNVICCKRSPEEEETEYTNENQQNQPVTNKFSKEIGDNKILDKRICSENNNVSTMNQVYFILY